VGFIERQRFTWRKEAAMKVLVSGASGLVGSALGSALEADGNQVVRLVRPGRAASGGFIPWNPASPAIDLTPWEGADAVVHLAGESVVGRWTNSKRARIRESRIPATRNLCETLAGLSAPPAVLVSASATGFYGDRGSRILREDAGRGDGFLSEIAEEWEAATGPAVDRGIRVVNLRIGIVLASRGGALGQMTPLFRMGMGGRLGPGTQFWSWIALDDLVGAIRFAINTPALSGPVNAVSPAPVLNADFTRTLARVLRRPAFAHVPGWALRLVMGQAADEMLLASTRVEPARLDAAGFRFRWPELESALRHALTVARASRP
jgi:hypothetical protein